MRTAPALAPSKLYWPPTISMTRNSTGRIEFELRGTDIVEVAGKQGARKPREPCSDHQDAGLDRHRITPIGLNGNFILANGPHETSVRGSDQPMSKTRRTERQSQP